jgi:hypothetical protein
VYELKRAGDKVTGTATREREGTKTEIVLKEIMVKGDQVSFVEPIKIQDQDVAIEYKGKLTGDEIKFSRKVGDFATTEITARRVKDSAASIDGEWKTEFDSQIGTQKYTYELKAAGEKLTGNAKGESQFGKFDTTITEGKINADSVSFVEMLKLPDREIRIDYSGKIAGDELKLTRKVGRLRPKRSLPSAAESSRDGKRIGVLGSGGRLILPNHCVRELRRRVCLSRRRLKVDGLEPSVVDFWPLR